MILSLGALDLAIVGLFLCGIIALGLSARLRENSVLQFLAAGRKLTLPVFVATLVSTWYGGILGVGESVAFFGLGAWVLIGVPYYVFAVIYALVFARKVREAEQISLPERLERKFGKSTGLLSAILVFLLAVPAAQVLMLGVLVETVTGWPFLAAISGGVVLGALFLYKGGLLADARVSILSFVMMYVGFGAIAVYFLTMYPPTETLGGLPSKLDKPDLFTWDGGSGIAYVISFFVLGAWTLVDPAFHQRVASAASPDVGRKGVLISAGLWFLFDTFSITAAMYALYASGPGVDGLHLYPHLAEQMLPPVLKGVFFCGMLGTILTAMVGYTLVSGATIGREVVARIRGGASDAQINSWIRAGVVVALAIAIVLAYNFKSVVLIWYAWSGVIIGALLLPVVFAYGRWRLPEGRWVFGSMIAAFSLSLAWLLYGKNTDNPNLELVWRGNTFSIGTLLPGLAVSALILGIGGLVKRSEQ